MPHAQGQLAKSPAGEPLDKRSRQRVGRPLKSENRDVRAGLLGAAVELFAARGFNSVSIRDITNEIGGSVGLVRHYFGSKDDLIVAANAFVIDELRSIFHGIAESIDATDGAAFIDQTQKKIVEALTPRVALLFYVRRLVSEDPGSATELFKVYFDLLQKTINQLEATGALPDDANRVWLTFQLMFVQLGPVFLAEQIEAILGQSPFEPEMIAARGEEITRVFKAALKPDA